MNHIEDKLRGTQEVLELLLGYSGLEVASFDGRVLDRHGWGANEAREIRPVEREVPEESFVYNTYAVTEGPNRRLREICIPKSRFAHGDKVKVTIEKVKP